MEIFEVNKIIESIKDKLPEGSISNIEKKLLVCKDDDKARQLVSELRNPKTAFILSIFLGMFGIDRLYIKDYCGVLWKAGFTIASHFYLFWILWLIDLFNIKSATKINNSLYLFKRLK